MSKKMKAVIWTRYGAPESLELREVSKPAPKNGELLIRIKAATVTAGDCETRRLDLPLIYRVPIRLYIGIQRPKRKKILGMELAGIVERTGNAVTEFNEGDEVFGTTGFALGAYAEYTCLPEKAVIARKPSGSTFEEAAAVPIGGLNAIHFLRLANIAPGQRILINGAGGSIGTFALQLAKHFGAIVTGVDDTRKLDMLKSLGADHVIDYTKIDFTQTSDTYDVVFDIACRKPFADCINTVGESGTYIIANPRMRDIIRGKHLTRRGGIRVITAPADEKPEDLAVLKELIEDGVIRSAIDRCFPLKNIVEAHHYVETGEKLGNVVITIDKE